MKERTGKRLLALLLAVSMALAGMLVPAQAADEDDNSVAHSANAGTAHSAKANAVLISSPEELTAIGSGENGVRYQLINDLTLTPDNWTPVEFKGNLDGQGHTITLTVNLPDQGNVGLFKENSGVIQNLIISVDSVVGRNNVGAVCGTNDGTIQKVKVVGAADGAKTIKAAKGYLGGLVGWNDGTITQCSVGGNVTVDGSEITQDGSAIGGLVGYNHRTISESCVYGVKADDFTWVKFHKTSQASGVWTGGLVGFSNDGTISNCYVYNIYIDGCNDNTCALFVGKISGGEIENCYACKTGALTGGYGVTVHDYCSWESSPTINNCYGNRNGWSNNHFSFTYSLDGKGMNWSGLRSEALTGDAWADYDADHLQLQWETEPWNVTWVDLTGDGKWNIDDVLTLMDYLSDSDVYTLTPGQLALAEQDNNNELNMDDVTAMMKNISTGDLVGVTTGAADDGGKTIIISGGTIL